MSDQTERFEPGEEDGPPPDVPTDAGAPVVLAFCQWPVAKQAQPLVMAPEVQPLRGMNGQLGVVLGLHTVSGALFTSMTQKDARKLAKLLTMAASAPDLMTPPASGGLIVPGR